MIFVLVDYKGGTAFGPVAELPHVTSVIADLDARQAERIAGAPALASRDTEERNGYNELFVAREGGAHILAVRTVRLDGGQWTPGEVYAFRPGAPGAPDERDLADLCADGPARQ